MLPEQHAFSSWPICALDVQLQKRLRRVPSCVVSKDDAEQEILSAQNSVCTADPIQPYVRATSRRVESLRYSDSISIMNM